MITEMGLGDEVLKVGDLIDHEWYSRQRLHAMVANGSAVQFTLAQADMLEALEVQPVTVDLIKAILPYPAIKDTKKEQERLKAVWKGSV